MQARCRWRDGPVRRADRGRALVANLAFSTLLGTIGVLIAGQLAIGVAIDRFELFGVEQVALSWPWLLGVLLLEVGGGAPARYRA